MCRPDGRHVLNNQGTDDYVLTFDHINALFIRTYVIFYVQHILFLLQKKSNFYIIC